MTEIKETVDHVNTNVRYLSYEMPGDGAGVMEFGDGESKHVFPPRGQVTHEYKKPGQFNVKVVRDGRTVAATTVRVKPNK